MRDFIAEGMEKRGKMRVGWIKLGGMVEIDFDEKVCCDLCLFEWKGYMDHGEFGNVCWMRNEGWIKVTSLM